MHVDGLHERRQCINALISVIRLIHIGNSVLSHLSMTPELWRGAKLQKYRQILDEDRIRPVTPSSDCRRFTHLNQLFHSSIVAS